MNRSPSVEIWMQATMMNKEPSWELSLGMRWVLRFSMKIHLRSGGVSTGGRGGLTMFGKCTPLTKCEYEDGVLKERMLGQGDNRDEPAWECDRCGAIFHCWCTLASFDLDFHGDFHACDRFVDDSPVVPWIFYWFCHFVPISYQFYVNFAHWPSIYFPALDLHGTSLDVHRSLNLRKHLWPQAAASPTLK